MTPKFNALNQLPTADSKGGRGEMDLTKGRQSTLLTG